MEMDLLPPLIAFEVNLLLGIFAARERSHEFSRPFAGLALAASTWCLGTVIYYLRPDSEIGLRLGFAGAAAIPPAFRLWCLKLAGRSVTARSLRISAVVWLLLLTVINGSLFLSGPGAYYFSLVQAAAVLLYFSGFYLAGFLALRPLLHRPENREARLVFLAGSLPFAAAVLYGLCGLTFLALPVFNEMLPVLIGAEILLYFGVRTHKVDLHELLSRTLLYLIYTVLTMAAVSLGLYVASRLFAFRVSLLALLGIGGFSLVLSAGFVAIRGRVENFIEATFFPQRAQYETRLREYESELGKAREQLQQAERLARIGELGAKVAHEIKNPLGPIKGYVQMLDQARQSGTINDAILDKALTIITEEVDKIDEKIHRLLDLSHRERNAPEPIRPGQLIDRTLALVETSPEIRISRRVGGEDARIFADPRKMQSALYNLVINALEALRGGGELTVSCAVMDGRVVLAVEDTGPGIPIDLLPRIFEPFQSGRGDGTGLGLAIVKTAVEEQGGEVAAANRPGGGARFTLSLPRFDEEGGKEHG